jgi:chemotaxis protein methyltransferase CheR
MAALLKPFKDLVRRRSGLVLDGLGEATLATAIAERSRATGAEEASAYFHLLGGSAAEFDEFVSLLTINETYFHRDPRHLTHFVERIVPRLMVRRKDLGRPIRILSAGCSTGEEPYSIAIALIERFGPAATGLFEIVGGDIDVRALNRAREGCYAAFSFRALAPELRARHFVPAGDDAFRISDGPRAMVTFRHLNLLADELPGIPKEVDAIFFRNVSIYFDEPTRRGIQERLRGLMAPDAVLFVGSTETLANDFGLLSLVEDDGIFYFLARPPSPANAVPPAPSPTAALPAAVAAPALAEARPLPAPSPAPAPAQVSILREREVDLGAIRSMLREKRMAHAQAVLGLYNRLLPPDARLLALEGYVHLVARRFEQAADLATRALAADEWSADARVLNGLTAKWREDAEASLRWFRQVVYVKPDCWPAHYYLGELYRARAENGPALRAYRAALLHIAAEPDPDGGLTLPLALPVADVRFLCRRHAATLERAGG